MANFRCSIIGLGKLGASIAAALASRGVDIIGVDVVEQTVELINAGQSPVQEPGLDEVIGNNRERLRATTNIREAVLASDITFVVVPTPSDRRGAFSLTYARHAFESIGRALADKHSYHNVVLTSTVLPGATRHGLLPLLEQASERRCGSDFGLCYSPEFIALGSVIRDFLYPDFLLIGESDRQAGEQLENFYQIVLPEPAPCHRMSLENAELAKIALNSFVTLKITFANLLADLCECLPGGDVDAVTAAIGQDRRIGHAYLRGGLGYGGPCFPRDNQAFSFLAQVLGKQADLAQVTDRLNRDRPSEIARHLDEHLPARAKVVVLGLAYKPKTWVVEESQGLAIAKLLATKGFQVTAFDPLATLEARKAIPDSEVVIVSSLSRCLEGAQAIIIASPDPLFKALTLNDLARCVRPVTVFDVWRIVSPEICRADTVRYLAVGQCQDNEGLTEQLKVLWDQGLTADNFQVYPE